VILHEDGNFLLKQVVRNSEFWMLVVWGENMWSIVCYCAACCGGMRPYVIAKAALLCLTCSIK